MNNVFNIFFLFAMFALRNRSAVCMMAWWRGLFVLSNWCIQRPSHQTAANKAQDLFPFSSLDFFPLSTPFCSLCLHWTCLHFLILVLFSSPTPKQCIVYFIQIVFLVNEQKYLYDWRWYHILKVSFCHHWAPIHVLLNINLSGGGGFVCRQTIKSSFKLSAHPTCWRDGWTKCQ